ncbi:hypothetical protein BGZ49_002421 [Haplosporangium sp. Z 27]|nr:hypothetical protein BGZ49_002421 [Haplosporangium sp. Z 27]
MSTTTAAATAITSVYGQNNSTSTPTSSTSTSLISPTATSSSNSTGGYDNGNSTLNGADAGSGSVSVQSVFYVIACFGLLLAIFYTIYAARRDRRRRRLARAAGDPEMAERNAITTYRPESSDEGKEISKNKTERYQTKTEKKTQHDDSGGPPQYRSYMLDEPYTESETDLALVYPDTAHHGARQSLIQHIALLGQHQQILDQDHDTDSTRPILTTTTTTTTTTTVTTAISSPQQQHVASFPLDTTTTAAAATAEESGNVAVSSSSGSIASPAPAHSSHSFFGTRPMSILRHGLFNYHRASSPTNSSRGGSPAVSIYVPPVSRPSSRHSNGGGSVNNDVESPATETTIEMEVNPGHQDSNTTDVEAAEESNNDHSRGHSGSEMPGSLSRLRSYGPPPYIPTFEDEAPALPPSYNAVASTQDNSTDST